MAELLKRLQDLGLLGVALRIVLGEIWAMDELGVIEGNLKWVRAYARSRYVLALGQLQFVVNCSKIKKVVGGKIRNCIEGSREPKFRRLTSPSAKPLFQLVLHLTNLVNHVAELLKRLQHCITPVLFVDSRWQVVS